MPSHTEKQAKVMSAIAHGWHPSQGSVAKIPVGVAKDFHAADKGRKYGKGRPGAWGPDPTERSVAAADVMLPHSSMGTLKNRSFHNQGFDRAPQNQPHYGKMGTPYRPPGPESPPKFGPYPAPASGADGYRHQARHGHERLSGDPRAHRIGKR